MLRTLQRPLQRAVALSSQSIPVVTTEKWIPIRYFSKDSRHDVVEPLRLHTEWIPSANDSDSSSILFLHGLLGSGRNLKTFARQVVKNRTGGGGGILMDLRGHGKSYFGNSAEQAAARTFQHCVDDVDYTLKVMSQQNDNDDDNNDKYAAPTTVVVGHSFGGRLALEYAAAASANGNPLDALWLLDTVPGQAHESVDQVIAAVSDILDTNKPIDRKDLVQALAEQYGMDKGVAQWLASSYNAKTGDFVIL